MIREGAPGRGHPPHCSLACSQQEELTATRTAAAVEPLIYSGLRSADEAKMSKTAVNADDSRVNVLIRLVGVVFFVLGIGMTYETFVQTGTQVIQPPLVPVLYLCSIMLVIAGFAALVSKYKGSTTPKA